MAKKTVFVRGMQGLGDCIYQRPFIRGLVAQASNQDDFVQLETPWPELYSDISGLRFFRPQRLLRTQTKNIDNQPPGTWSQYPLRIVRTIQISYASTLANHGTILGGMESGIPDHYLMYDDTNLGKGSINLDLPDVEPPFTEDDINYFGTPIAVVRPVTVRKEWANKSRNPLPQYINEISGKLSEHYFVVSVADLEPNQEWTVEPEPFAHMMLHKGQLNVKQLLGLVKQADIVVGGPGWIVPASIAAKVPSFIVLGGCGTFNNPRAFLDPRIDSSKIGFGIPDNFCKCNTHNHNCDKTISNLNEQFDAWADRVGIRH